MATSKQDGATRRHNVGRPTKFTPKARQRFCDALRAGAPQVVAGRFAGWSATATKRYLARARRAKDGELWAFWSLVQRAHAEAAVTLVRLISAQARRDWRAAAWLLERRKPEDYGPPRLRQFLHRRTDTRPVVFALDATCPPPPPQFRQFWQRREKSPPDLTTQHTDNYDSND